VPFRLDGRSLSARHSRGLTAVVSLEEAISGPRRRPPPRALQQNPSLDSRKQAHWPIQSASNISHHAVPGSGPPLRTRGGRGNRSRPKLSEVGVTPRSGYIVADITLLQCPRGWMFLRTFMHLAAPAERAYSTSHGKRAAANIVDILRHFTGIDIASVPSAQSDPPCLGMRLMDTRLGKVQSVPSFRPMLSRYTDRIQRHHMAVSIPSGNPSAPALVPSSLQWLRRSWRTRDPHLFLLACPSAVFAQASLTS